MVSQRYSRYVVEEQYRGAKAKTEGPERYRVAHARRETGLTIIKGTGTMNASKSMAKYPRTS